MSSILKDLKKTWLDGVKVLESFVNKLESDYGKHYIDYKTNAYVDKIKNLFIKKDVSHWYKSIRFYISKWFKNIIAVRDEIMLLISGIMRRNYHKHLHNTYKHSRNHENEYFNHHNLSYCSTDGLNYEWRRIKMQYKNKWVYYLIYYSIVKHHIHSKISTILHV